MKELKNKTELSVTERFSQISEIYAGITGQIYKSDVEKRHQALYAICYPTALGFGLLALFRGSWFGYAFFSLVMGFYALIITVWNGRNKRRRKSQVESRAK